MPLSIRSPLLLLVSSVLLPGALAALVSVWAVWTATQAGADADRARRAVLERELARTARALARGVDAELDRGAAIARALAASPALATAPSLSPAQRRAFERQAERAMRGEAGWAELRGREDGPLHDAPDVGPLQADPAGRGWRAAVVEPVGRDGATVLNVVVAVVPAGLQRLLDDAALPPGWTGAVLDPQGRPVARHPGGAASTGPPSAADVKPPPGDRGDGRFAPAEVEGRPGLAYVSPSRQGWRVVVAMPLDAPSGGPAGMPLAAAAAGMLALLALAAVVAVRVGRGLAAQAAARTQEAERRLSQYRRLEAMGRLAGPLAHDLNNLLGVISNGAYLIQHLAPTPEVHRHMAATLRAVERGSRLAGDLLRLAGGPAAGAAQEIEPGRDLPAMQALLRTALGPRLPLEVKVAPHTRRIQADPGGLEAALIHLALDARESLTEGGRVWLAARDADKHDLVDGLPVRPYVLVTFSDDGRRRTGSPGDGLDHVRAFCAQAGGSARLMDTPGLGSTVSLLLPAVPR